MEIKLPNPVFIRSGHFVQVRITPLSKREWHSISVLNGGTTSGTVKVLIKNLGDWTERLYRLSQCMDEIEVDVRGFYASPMASAPQASQVLCVAGGIGITPVLSAVNGCMQRLREGENKQMDVVWVFQDWTLLAMLQVDVLRSQAMGVSWHLFATTDCPEGVVIQERVQVSIRRPCIETEVRRFELEREGQKHAFVCGPKVLAESVKRQVRKKSDWQIAVEHF